MPTRDPRVDAYITKSADFAKPILLHIRDVVHATCPDVEETMKWSSPHFDYHGMLCAMSALKEHCALGFWKASLIEGLGVGDGSAGSFGRLTTVADLPPRKVLVGYVQAAMRLNEEGTAVPKTRGAPKPEATIPPDLAAALAKNKKAKAAFAAFPPSHRREYIDWITDAKREETRAKRVAQTVEWVAEGKSRNWKY